MCTSSVQKFQVGILYFWHPPYISFPLFITLLLGRLYSEHFFFPLQNPALPGPGLERIVQSDPIVINMLSPSTYHASVITRDKNTLT